MGRSLFTAANSVECFTTTVSTVPEPSGEGTGRVRLPRKTKLVVPLVSRKRDEQAYGVLESCCRILAIIASFSDCSSAAIVLVLGWHPVTAM